MGSIIPGQGCTRLQPRQPSRSLLTHGRHRRGPTRLPLWCIHPASSITAAKRLGGNSTTAMSLPSAVPPYNHTRLPNLVVTDVDFSQENVAGTDTFYLDTKIMVLNKIGDDGLRPPPVTNSFDVRIEFKASLPCPFGAVAPCEVTLRIDGIDRGAGVTRRVEGTVPLPLPRSGGVHEYRVVVTVDPFNVVDESDESDNTTETTNRVTNN